MGELLNVFLQKVKEEGKSQESDEEEKYLMPYDELSKLILNYDIQDYKRYSEFQLVTTENINDYDDYKEDLLNRLNRQINLNIVQAQSVTESAREAHRIAEDASGTASYAKSIKDRIYTDFITILGVFTAVTFATFGGLQLLGDALRGLNNKITAANIGGELVIAALILLVVYLIIRVLISGLEELIDKNKGKYPIPNFLLSKRIIIIVIMLIILGYIFACTHVPQAIMGWINGLF